MGAIKAESPVLPRDIAWSDLSNLQHLADGAMCSCYTATWKGQKVCVKRPRVDSKESKQEIDRELELELALLIRLQHPNIVQLLATGLTDQGERFLVLEHLEGGTLASILQGFRQRQPRWHPFSRQRHLPLTTVLQAAKQLAAALHYMHVEASQSAAYIYRDLKSENIGFTADGTLKLFDFGLARRMCNSHRTVHGAYQMTGQTGTVRYMAPEVFLCQRYNESVDVYGWAHVVVEMLTLHKPYHTYNITEFQQCVVKEGGRPKLSPKWPLTLRQLLSKCWHAEPALRPCFREVLQLLGQCGKDTDVLSTSQSSIESGPLSPDSVDLRIRQPSGFSDESPASTVSACSTRSLHVPQFWRHGLRRGASGQESSPASITA